MYFIKALKKGFKMPHIFFEPLERRRNTQTLLGISPIYGCQLPYDPNTNFSYGVVPLYAAQIPDPNINYCVPLYAAQIPNPGITNIYGINTPYTPYLITPDPNCKNWIIIE